MRALLYPSQRHGDLSETDTGALNDVGCFGWRGMRPSEPLIKWKSGEVVLSETNNWLGATEGRGYSITQTLTARPFLLTFGSRCRTSGGQSSPHKAGPQQHQGAETSGQSVQIGWKVFGDTPTWLVMAESTSGRRIIRCSKGSKGWKKSWKDVEVEGSNQKHSGRRPPCSEAPADSRISILDHWAGESRLSAEMLRRALKLQDSERGLCERTGA